MVRTSRITTAIKMVRLAGWVLAAACMLPPAVLADDGLSVDARFDKTGDRLVDASDWPKMSGDEQAAYARASLEALGENPDVALPDGQTRAAQYLKGLQAVYE